MVTSVLRRVITPFLLSPFTLYKLRKDLSLSIFMLFVCASVSNAQINEYIFNIVNGTYTPITGGTLLATATNHTTSSITSLDQGNFAATIPFSFTVNGTAYTSCNVNANGFITFGATLPTETLSSPISSTTAYEAAVSPMAKDLWGVYGTTGTRAIGSATITGVTSFVGLSNGKPIRGAGIPAGATVTSFDVGAGTITISAAATTAVTLGYIGWPIAEIRAEAIGTAPNRVFVIQFSGYSDFSTTPPLNCSFDFQIHLEEGGGVPSEQFIKFIYGPHSNLNTSSRTNQVGLRGLTNADYNNRASTTDWSATTAGTSNSSTVTRTNLIFPATDLTYSWEPATCFKPTALTSISFSHNSGNLSWTAPAMAPSSGYQWEVRTSGEAGSGNTGLAASGSTGAGVTTAVATGLSASTSYSVYVRSNCGGADFSLWTGPATFSTLCSPVVPPYTQDFTTYTGAAPATLTCWSEFENGTPPASPIGPATSVWTSDGFGNNGTTGAAKIILSSNVDRDWLVSPLLNLSGGPYLLKADFSLTTSGSTTQGVFGADDEVKVLISTDFGSSWITLETFNTGNTPPGTGVTKSYDLAAYSNMTVLIAIWGNEGATTNTTAEFFVDNFFLEIPTACTSPTTLTATNPTLTGATLGWTENGSATLWDLEIIPSSSTPTGNPTNNDVSTNPFVWTGGMATTSYKFYVRADCGGTGVSNWIGPFTFFTLPGNDEPAGAIALSVGTPQSILTVNATETLPACTGTADDDVWYVFTPPADGTYSFAFTGLTGATDIGYQIFLGLPSNGISLACHDGPDGGASFDGFLASNTYYVRVYAWSSSTSTDITGGNITISSYSLTPPSNNDCATALSITPSPNGACLFTAMNSTNATYSLLKPSCITSLNPPASDDDIWVTFTATVSGPHIFKTQTTGTYGIEAYTGSCGSLTPVGSSCSTSFTGTTGFTIGLTASTIYSVRIWRTSTGGGAIDLCVEMPVACSTPTATAATMLTSTTAQANWSCPSCSGTYIIEYGPSATFTTPGVDNNPGANGIIATAGVGATNVVLMGLSPTTQYRYFVRQNCTGGGNGYSSNSSGILFTTLGLPPANDNASSAIALTIGAACSGNSYSNVNATLSLNEPYPSCSGSAFTPVWFSFVAPASGAVRVTTDFSGGTFTDPKIAIFSASNVNDYSTFQIQVCDDDGGSTVNFASVLYMTGLSAGTTYYIAVDKFGSTTTNGTYCIQVDELAVSMLSSTNTCGSTFQTPGGFNTTYNQWIPLMDGASKLIALVKNAAGGEVDNYSTGQNVHTTSTRHFGGVSYLDRNFFVANSATIASLNVQVFFTDGEFSDLQAVEPSISSLSDLRITAKTGTCINNFTQNNQSLLNQTGNGSAGGVAWVQFTTPTLGNFFIHGGSVALPINLLSFEGVAMKDYNKVMWFTENEVNFDQFEVQRASSTTGQFTSIGTVKSGNRSGGDYVYEDKQPLSSGFYRLKMMDLDGQFSYSKVIHIKRSGTTFAIRNIFPNPSTDVVNVELVSPEKMELDIRLVDISGKEIRTMSASLTEGEQTVIFSLEGIQPGTYFLHALGQVSKVVRL